MGIRIQDIKNQHRKIEKKMEKSGLFLDKAAAL